MLFDSLEVVIITMHNAGHAKSEHHEMPAILTYITYAMNSRPFPSEYAYQMETSYGKLTFCVCLGFWIKPPTGIEALGNYSKAC